MKKNKLLSIFSALTLGAGIVCSNCAVSAEKAAGTKANYTLAELFEMSDDEFLRLDKAEYYLNQITNDADLVIDRNEDHSGIVYGGVSGRVYTWLDSADSDLPYTANLTEKQDICIIG